jgi:valyl-tRNA synthetase
VEGEAYDKDFNEYSEIDSKLIEERHSLMVEINSDIENYRLYLAAEKLYHYTWHRYADVILEESKKILKEGSPAEIKSRKQFLLHTLVGILKCLHPFIPFVTEEIWKDMPVADKRMLIVEDWPV